MASGNVDESAKRFDLIYDNFEKIIDALADVEIDKKFTNKLESLEEPKETSGEGSSDSCSSGKSKGRNKSKKKDSDGESASPSVAHKQPLKKQSIKNFTREWMWYHLENRTTALDSYPRPVYGKTPHFRKTRQAARNLSELKEYMDAKVIHAGSSMSVMPFREMVLGSKELLYSNIKNISVEDVMYCIQSKDLKTRKDFGIAATKKGLLRYGKPVSMGFKSPMKKIDMMVVGSVAVAKNGVRLGTGMGDADLVWGMFYDMGVVDKNTLVATIVADEQVLGDSDLPESTRWEYDVPVDIICTPSRVYRVKNKLPKPCIGISSKFLTDEVLKRCPVLKRFDV